MKCICGYDVGEPPFLWWEECPSCERKLDTIESQHKLLAIIEAAKEIVRTAKADKTFPMNTHVPSIKINMLQRSLEALENREVSDADISN